MSTMPTWNVLVSVVELVDAATSEAAIDSLKAKLRSAGFDPYEGDPGNAFESEET